MLVHMNKTHNIGDFEQILLLAILRLQDNGAYGVSIRREIAANTSRKPTPGAIYTTLDRLEQKGMVSSWSGDATPERGGRAKRFYKVTTKGRNSLKRTQQEYRNLLSGLDLMGEYYA